MKCNQIKGINSANCKESDSTSPARSRPRRSARLNHNAGIAPPRTLQHSQMTKLQSIHLRTLPTALLSLVLVSGAAAGTVSVPLNRDPYRDPAEVQGLGVTSLDELNIAGGTFGALDFSPNNDLARRARAFFYDKGYVFSSIEARAYLLAAVDDAQIKVAFVTCYFRGGALWVRQENTKFRYDPSATLEGLTERQVRDAWDYGDTMYYRLDVVVSPSFLLP